MTNEYETAGEYYNVRLQLEAARAEYQSARKVYVDAMAAAYKAEMAAIWEAREEANIY